MILYRVQAHLGNTWSTQWLLTLADARAEAKDLAEFDRHIDKIEIPTGREGIMLALNNADVNRVNWPGEPVEYHEKKR